MDLFGDTPEDDILLSDLDFSDLIKRSKPDLSDRPDMPADAILAQVGNDMNHPVFNDIFVRQFGNAEYEQIAKMFPKWMAYERLIVHRIVKLTPTTMSLLASINRDCMDLAFASVSGIKDKRNIIINVGVEPDPPRARLFFSEFPSGTRLALHGKTVEQNVRSILRKFRFLSKFASDQNRFWVQGDEVLFGNDWMIFNDTVMSLLGFTRVGIGKLCLYHFVRALRRSSFLTKLTPIPPEHLGRCASCGSDETKLVSSCCFTVAYCNYECAKTHLPTHICSD
jgi:hypothetical protein